MGGELNTVVVMYVGQNNFMSGEAERMTLFIILHSDSNFEFA